MAKRVFVDRLRPQTTEQVFINPVSTYEQPKEVEQSRLAELASFVERIEPRVTGYLNRERERDKEEDKKRAREIAETTVANYDQLVKEGKIGPEESPVFRYAFNETRGKVAGYEFIQEAVEAYNQSSLTQATDASSFDDWYNKYYEVYVSENQGILGQEGAYEQFSNVAGQARSNLLTSHLASVKQNFANQGQAAYGNFVARIAQSHDVSTPEGAAAFASFIKSEQDKLAASGGATFSYSNLNKMTVDNLYKYYESQGYKWQDFKNALNAIDAGTGKLGGTLHAQEQLAEARVKWNKALIAEEEQEEKIWNINKDRTKNKYEHFFNTQLFQGNYNVGLIEADMRKEFGDDFIYDLETYVPDFRNQMMEKLDTWRKNKVFAVMSVGERTKLREKLERLSPSGRVAQVIEWGNNNRITDVSVYNNLMSYASSSAEAFKRNKVERNSHKDPVYKAFEQQEFTGRMDKYVSLRGAQRQQLFMSSYYLMYDEIDEETGEFTWDNKTDLEKRQALFSLMMTVNETIQTDSEEFDPLATNELVYDDDGKPLYIMGKPVTKARN